MSETKQIVCIVREDYISLLKKAEYVIRDVMAAGERQRLASGRDPNGWMKINPIDRIKHAIDHLLPVWHHRKMDLLTCDTELQQAKHALVDILIALVNEDREPEQLQEVIEE